MPTLNWIGKDAVVGHHLQVPFHLLKDVPDLGCGKNGTGNLIVQGDNLVALKALLPYYAGQVKCIYIDPPYNTGNEGWVYNDNVSSPLIEDGKGSRVERVGFAWERGKVRQRKDSTHVNGWLTGELLGVVQCTHLATHSVRAPRSG